jgi:glycosyltransferase involved in cell wall biosynthesis
MSPKLRFTEWRQNATTEPQKENFGHKVSVQKTKPVAIVTSTIPTTIAACHCELIRQVQDEGYDVCVVSSPGPELERIRIKMGVRVRSIPMTRKISGPADLIALVQWFRVCLAERPSFLISATPKASMLSQLAGKVTRVHRRLYYLGGLRLEGDRGRRRQLLTIIERITSWAATEIVANSPSLAAQFTELRLAPLRKLRQTHPASSHGVDSSHFSPQRPDVDLASELGIDCSIPVIGFVGRLTHDKGIDCLMSAIALLDAEHITCQLLVIGDQEEPDSAIYLDALKTMGDRVVTIAGVDDVRPYYGLMDIHVLPSLREGFPNVVLEASAMGLPTVTTDATGAIDSVRNCETGLIVKTQDALSLAAALKSLVLNPSRAIQYGLAARKWVIADFQPESVVRTLLAFNKSSDVRSVQCDAEH